MCVHKLVDQSIRVDQIDLNVWPGEGGHRCIYNLVRRAVPPSAGINLATMPRARRVAPIQDEDLVVRRDVTGTVPLLLSLKIRAHSTCFAQEEPQLLFSEQVPCHGSFSQPSPPAPRAEGAGSVGLHHRQPRPVCAAFTGKQGPVTSPAFPPAADPGNVPASAAGFPRRDRKSSGPVIFLPRS